jgi:hypothetical protein
VNIRDLSFAVLALGLCFGNATQAAESTRFHLDLNRPPPKIGDETDRTIHFSSTTSDSTTTQGRESTTNGCLFFELNDRETVLDWDVSNDWSKVEMVVHRFVDGDDHRTNELLKAGTRIVGTALLGATFYESKDAPLSTEAYQQLVRSYRLRPRDFTQFTHFQIPPSTTIGETWEMPAPTNIEELVRVLGPSYTNTIQATGQFVGTTNLFGFDCFHLRFRILATEIPEALRTAMTSHLPVSVKGQLGMTIDLTVPFDVSRRTLREEVLTEFSDSGDMVIDGKHVMSSHGQVRLDFVDESRPIK